MQAANTWPAEPVHRLALAGIPSSLLELAREGDACSSDAAMAQNWK